MKIKYLSLLAFSFMVMLSCADDNAPEVTPGITPEIPNDNKEESVLTFTGIIEGTNSARTAFGQYNQGEYGVFWTEGDNISVYTKSGKLQSYNLTAGAGSDRGTFTFDKDIDVITAPSAHYAVYPYTLNSNDYDYTAGHDYNYSFSGGKLTLDLSNLAEQTHNVNDDQQGDDKFQLTKSIMTAKSTDTTLKFENALAMLHVNVCAGKEKNYKNFTVHEIKLTVNGEQSLWGEGAIIDMDSNDPKAIIPDKTGQNEIILKMPNDEGVKIVEDCAELGQGTNYDSNYNYNLGGRDFYILLPAATYNGFKINVTVSCDQIGTADEYIKHHEFTLTKYWDEITFDRSYINSLHRSIDALISYEGTVYADILDVNEVSLTDPITLEIAREGKLYWPFFESIEDNLSKVDKNVTLKGTEENGYLEMADPTCAPTYFTTLNNHTFTIEDVEFKGEISILGLGHYYKKNSTNYTTIMNNVKVDGIKVRMWGTGAVRCAVFNYGDATLNNCIIKNSQCSESCPKYLDDNALAWKGEDRLYHDNYLNLSADELKKLTYDLGTQNSTTLTLNGGEYGKIFVYEHGQLHVNGAKIDLITDGCCLPTKALITINNKSEVNYLYLTGDSYPNGSLYSNVKINAGAIVNTLVITKYVKDDGKRNIVIENGATINNIVFDGVTYTSSEFAISEDRKTITFTKEGNTIVFELVYNV